MLGFLFCLVASRKDDYQACASIAYWIGKEMKRGSKIDQLREDLIEVCSLMPEEGIKLCKGFFIPNLPSIMQALMNKKDVCGEFPHGVKNSRARIYRRKYH